MSGGGGGPVARVIGQIDAANRSGSGGPTPGTAYTPVQQGPVYQPQYQPQQYQPQQMAPQYQQQMPNYMSGLQAAMANIMQQYNRPMMRAPMPRYSSK